MDYTENPEYIRELNQLNMEIDIEDELAKASQQIEMQGIMEEAYRKSREYGQGFSDGFVAGTKFYHEKESGKWISRKRKYEDFNRRWGTAS